MCRVRGQGNLRKHAKNEASLPEMRHLMVRELWGISLRPPWKIPRTRAGTAAALTAPGASRDRPDARRIVRMLSFNSRSWLRPCGTAIAHDR